MSTPIDDFSPAHHGTKLVYGSRPEPRVDVVSLNNGSRISCTVSIAASLIVAGDVELIGEMNDATRAVFDAAVSAQLAIHAVRRARR